MVEKDLLFNAVCIYLLILGSLLGAIGYFKVSTKSLENQASFWFFSEDYFKSLLEQKYYGIFGFLLIGLGSLGQLMLYFFNFTNDYFEIRMTITVISIVIVLTLFVFWVLKKIIYLQEKKILIPHYLREYNSIISRDNYKDYPDYSATVKELSNLLGISKSRNEEQHIGYVVKKGCEFCKKRNIKV